MRLRAGTLLLAVLSVGGCVRLIGAVPARDRALDGSGADTARGGHDAAADAGSDTGGAGEAGGPDAQGDGAVPATCGAGGVAWTNSAGNGLWSDPQNWSTGAVPQPTEVPTFGAACPACGVTIDVAVDLGGLCFDPSYSGTLTQGAGKSITLGADGWVQHGGKFQGSDAQIVIDDGPLLLEGGVFQSTSGTLLLTPGKQILGQTLLRIGAGAAWQPGSGLVHIDFPGTGNCYGDVTIELLNPKATFNDFSAVPDFAAYSRCNITVASGSVAVIDGSLLAGSTGLHGAWRVKGDLDFSAQHAWAEATRAAFVLDGSAGQTITPGGRRVTETTVTVDRQAAGAVLLAGDLDLTAQGQILTIVGGQLKMQGHALTAASLVMQGGSITRGGGALTVNGQTVSDGPFGGGTINP
jgi:hypothetical protein